MDAERIWGAKTDDEVLNAYQQLDDYTDEGRSILKAEIERRQLTTLAPFPPPVVPDAIAATNPIARLWAGGYSLPMTYWVWGQLGIFVWLAAAAIVTSAAVRQTLGLGLLAYMVLVGVGVWRSTGHYKGSPGWATLASVAVLAPVVMSVMRLIFAAFGPVAP